MGYLIWAISTWESVALATQKLGLKWAPPTVSEAMWRLVAHGGPWAAMITGSATSWLWYHFFLERRG